MTNLCPTCQSTPVLEHHGAGYRYGCPNRTRRTVREGFAGSGCPNYVLYVNTTEKGARKSWNRATEQEPGKCVCGLRLPCNSCLVGSSGTARDASYQWWSRRDGNHKYSDEGTEAR